VQVGFEKTLFVTRPDPVVAARQQIAMQRELRRVWRIGSHQCIEVFGVVGVELRLDHGGR
jgi:hypothetical protein